MAELKPCPSCGLPMKPGDAGIVHTYFGVAHGLPRCVALLQAEIDRLRAALIKAGRAAGAQMTDEVSTDFLMHVPDEIEAKIFALSEECSREPEPAAEPQETADPGQGIDIPETVKSSGIREPREYRTPKRLYTPSPMPDAPVSETPNDSPKTAIPEPVPPRTLEGDSEPSDNGTQWRDIATAPKDGTAIILWPLELEDETRATVGHWYVHPAVQGFITPEIDCGDFEFEPTHWQPLPGGIE